MWLKIGTPSSRFASIVFFDRPRNGVHAWSLLYTLYIGAIVVR